MASTSGQHKAARAVLAIDGLPLGTDAVLAHGCDVVLGFSASGGNGRPMPLEQRVLAAVDKARAHTEVELSEVRLVLVDDGEDGSVVDEIADRLAMEQGLLMTVMHPSSIGGWRQAPSLEAAALR